MYEELYAQNKGLLISMARRYARLCALDRAVSEQDLIQAGFIGLVKAAATYDEAGGMSWASWASRHVRREFEGALGMRHGRFLRAHTGADTLDRRVGDADGERATLGELLADDSQPEADATLLQGELRQAVWEAVERLRNESQRQVLRQCKLEGRSYRQAAEDLGISVARAHRLCKRAGVNLSRDWRLRQQLDLDARTRFHAHKGVEAFNRDWTSVTEAAALWRIDQQKKPPAHKS